MSVELDGVAEDITAEDTKAEDIKAEDTKVDDTSVNTEPPPEGVQDGDTKDIDLRCSSCLGHIYRLAQLIYWRILVIVIGLVQLCAMILYGGELLNHDELGIFFFAWFTTVTAVSVFQIPVHLLILIPGRFSKTSYDSISAKKHGAPLREDRFYKDLKTCNYCLLFVVITNWCFLAGVYEEYIFKHTLEPEFGALFIFSTLLYSILLTVRVVSILVGVEKKTFYNPFWDPVKEVVEQQEVTALYSSTYEVTFHGICNLWAACDGGMIIFSFFLTYAVSDYDPKNDLIQNFYEVWHPCILIDHFPSSLAGMALIGVREIFACIFSLLMFIFVWKKSGIEETLICGTFLTVGQVMMFCIVNAFSAQLYAPGEEVGVTTYQCENVTVWELGFTPGDCTQYLNGTRNKTVWELGPVDKVNAKEHTIAYLMWLVGNIIVFYYSYRMLKMYKAPLGMPPGTPASCQNKFRKIFWWVMYWFGSNFVVITITACMFVTIINTSIVWAKKPVGFIQSLLGFLWFSVEGINRYIGMLIAPMQRFIFPAGMGIKFTIAPASVKSDGKTKTVHDGSIGRGSKLFTAALFVLFALVLGTNMWGSGNNAALFPLAQGFLVKPWVFVFAPTWLANSVLLGYCFIVTGYQLSCGKMNSNYLFFYQLVSAVFLLFFFIQLFVVIPYWQSGNFLAISLSLSFIIWLIVAQKASWQVIIWAAIGVVISIFGLKYITDANLSNWVGVGSLLFFMTYSSLFPGDTQLFVGIEIIPPTEGWLEDEKDNETEKKSCCCNC